MSIIVFATNCYARNIPGNFTMSEILIPWRKVAGWGNLRICAGWEKEENNQTQNKSNADTDRWSKHVNGAVSEVTTAYGSNVDHNLSRSGIKVFAEASNACLNAQTDLWNAEKLNTSLNAQTDLEQERERTWRSIAGEPVYGNVTPKKNLAVLELRKLLEWEPTEQTANVLAVVQAWQRAEKLANGNNPQQACLNALRNLEFHGLRVTYPEARAAITLVLLNAMQRLAGEREEENNSPIGMTDRRLAELGRAMLSDI
jgi:hypothetical protein